MPSTPALQGADLALAVKPGGQAILRELLKDVARDYDLALLDCPPALGFYTTSALCSAQWVLAPVPCEPLAIAGLAQLTDAMARARKYLGADVRLLAHVLFATDARESLTAETRAMLEREAPGRTLTAEVRTSAASKVLPLRRAVAWDVGAADPRGREDYDAILKETAARLEGRRK